MWNAVCVNEWEYYFLPWRIKHGPVQPSSEPRSDAELTELYSISLLQISLLLNSSISSDVISDVFKNCVSFWFTLMESESGCGSVMLDAAGTWLVYGILKAFSWGFQKKITIRGNMNQCSKIPGTGTNG